MNFLNNTGLEYFYNKLKEKFIRSVNSQTPDANGNVTITNVAAADNLISPDAQTSYDTFTYRTSGGSASISNGEAQLIYIDGNIDIVGRIHENFSIDVNNNVIITYNAPTWRTQIDESGEYVFNYTKPASSAAVSSWSPSLGVWTYNNSVVSLDTYGLESSNIFAPNINIAINGSNIRNPQIVPNIWMNLIESSDNYDFIYDGNSWTFNDATINLSTYGITISGTPEEGDTITINYNTGTPDTTLVINYTAPEQGTILVAKPTAFSSTGFNQFDSESMYIQNASIVNGVIASNSGTYIAYCRAKGGVTNGYVAYSSNAYIRNIGWCETLPTIGTSVITTGSSISNTLASIPFEEDGYVVVVTTNISDLCIHPKWSGSADTEYQAYTTPSVINLPTTAIDGSIIPLGTYGMPSVGQVADRLNLDAGVYVQNIGRYDYSLSNLEAVQALGVEYEYDYNNIFYVLNNPVSYNVSVDQIYTVNDFGTEEFLDTPVSVKAYMLYGQNLRDKLRTDVLTISQQTPSLTENQRQQVLSNIGISNISNPNLLDNWYFSGGGSQLGNGIFPINQRGKTSYSAGYGIDRWNLGMNGTLTINSGYITAANADTTYRRAFGQTIENPNRLRGKTVTATVLLSNGTLVTKSDTIPSSAPDSVEYHPTISFNNHTMRCEITPSGTITFNFMVAQSSSISIVAAKFELGSTQTLAHQENGVWVLNEVPDYAEQLAKCLRYYRRIGGATSGYSLFYGIAFSSTQIRTHFDVPLGMAKVPTITVSNIGNFRLEGNGTLIIPTSIQVSSSLTTTRIPVYINASNLTQYQVYAIVALSNAYIELSAET